MANQKEIRARISSTISTQQITKAMKLVSATKLRKASEAIKEKSKATNGFRSRGRATNLSRMYRRIERRRVHLDNDVKITNTDILIS